ncbi:transcriptional regulator TrmB [Amycolatopsis sp. EV170708-02-1]|uniref:transcriptional regulator TrmB n=1 Tax=Amycolatopsis sp. EV170708-02-1 TaxID=2919322 RepID=UPI001F0C557F|nr:transcriptional regulator TrmB [Amycolatopsis sp. EV170708-02-1]UMP06800.1 transcriptional regulator TrmB [Amycolatopsis sp. EV170708-02-1]
MLEIVGLDAAAQTVYEFLVDSPPVTFDDIRGQTGLGGEQLRRLLDRLEALSLVIRTEHSPPAFTTPAPDAALEVLLLEQQERIKRARIYAEQLSARNLRTAAGWEPSELVEVVTGADVVAQRVEQFLRGTSKEIRFVDKHPYVVAPKVLAPVEAQMLERGVVFRALYDTAGLATRSVQTEVEPAIARGEQARVLPEAPVKLILSDNRRAMLPLQVDPTMVESVVIVHPSALLDALGAFFEVLWRSAAPLSAAEQGELSADSVGVEDLRLIGLLTAGLPDQAIARQLGLSYRTFQRRLVSLIESLGARTRFQAGLQVAFRGLVPNPVADSTQRSTSRAPLDP